MYPTWAEALGLMMSLSSMVMVPGYAVYYVLTQPGTIMQVSQDPLLEPSPMSSTPMGVYSTEKFYNAKVLKLKMIPIKPKFSYQN